MGFVGVFLRAWPFKEKFYTWDQIFLKIMKNRDRAAKIFQRLNDGKPLGTVNCPTIVLRAAYKDANKKFNAVSFDLTPRWKVATLRLKLIYRGCHYLFLVS